MPPRDGSGMNCSGLSRIAMAEDADTLIHTYRNHSLKGEWAGFRELHIEGDWLLIYRIDHGELCLVLTCTGSHDALFGRGGKNF